MRPAERRALLTLLGLALVGHGVRLGLARPGDPPGAVGLPGGQADPRAHADSARRLSRPLAPGERIDLDRAGTVELVRLPRVGPALARAIVSDREANGPFGSLEGLGRVRGIGPGTLRLLEPHARFSGTARGAGAAGKAGKVATAGEGPQAIVDLNLAGPEELARLPGIGPSRAAAIVAWRARHGRFGRVEDLVRVPGVGPRTVEGLRGRVGVEGRGERGTGNGER
ncbi:MAG TPA: helix-hairpin-helix domain-containing protein [Gemmatimonadales bacterium]|nr:helix-hairpin-helix domain-containing protein [Gemmatimonadales bacterium]